MHHFVCASNFQKINFASKMAQQSWSSCCRASQDTDDINDKTEGQLHNDFGSFTGALMLKTPTHDCEVQPSL
jgi:hypothetical protein